MTSENYYSQKLQFLDPNYCQLAKRKKVTFKMYRANSGNKQGICMETMFSLVVYSMILVNVVRCESPGHSLVTCTACQAVQAKDFSCNVNCRVANESNGRYYIWPSLHCMYTSISKHIISQRNKNRNIENLISQKCTCFPNISTLPKYCRVRINPYSNHILI